MNKKQHRVWLFRASGTCLPSRRHFTSIISKKIFFYVQNVIFREGVEIMPQVGRETLIQGTQNVIKPFATVVQL